MCLQNTAFKSLSEGNSRWIWVAFLPVSSKSFRKSFGHRLRDAYVFRNLPGQPLMLCLDKEKAIALTFSWPSRLFVFIFIYRAEKLCALLFSNILHTHSVTDIKNWELPNATTVWCQSAAPSEQSAIKHLAQGHLQRSCWGSKKACLIPFLHPDFPCCSGHECAFWIFASGHMLHQFTTNHFLPFFSTLPIILTTRYPRVAVRMFELSTPQTAAVKICNVRIYVRKQTCDLWRSVFMLV